MKVLVILFSLLALSACEAKETKVKTPAPSKAATAVTTPKAIEKAKEPDCDDKAKKIEIKHDQIKLGNPDAGCSLE